MGKITGGEFRYLRRVKTGDYEHKEVDVKMSWSSDDGDSLEQTNTLVNVVEGEVIARAGRMLSAQLKAGAVAATTPPSEPDGGTPDMQAPAQPRTRGRPPGSPNRPKVTEEKSADPLDMPGDVSPSAPETTSAGSTDGKATADPAAIDLMTAEETVVVTDMILQDKITRKNARMIEAGVSEAPKRIKKLIAEYAGGPAPKTARDIPPEKRVGFLLELDKAESVVL